MKTFLITGAAGFIGFHLSKYLLSLGNRIVGIDNLNNYYDVNLKKARLDILKENKHFTFYQLDIFDHLLLSHLFTEIKFDMVVHFAAQAGIRYSLTKPLEYAHSNLVGFTNILEACRHHGIGHLVFASSSSIYGHTRKQPLHESDSTDSPISFYAATKKANELMAHSYASLYQLPCTGLRFFTVYGPWGRPDMAPFKFTQKIIEGLPIQVYNQGNMWRDFTYIDDVIAGIAGILDKPPKVGEHPENPYAAPYQIFNVGNHQPVKLLDFLLVIEEITKKKAIIEYLPIQPGDVLFTCANIDRLQQVTGYKPTTSIKKGMQKFIVWYDNYYQIAQSKPQ